MRLSWVWRSQKYSLRFSWRLVLITKRFLASDQKCFGWVSISIWTMNRDVHEQINNLTNLMMKTFQYAEEPFLHALQTTLDERYTPQMDVIYRVIAQYIIQTLIDGYNKWMITFIDFLFHPTDTRLHDQRFCLLIPKCLSWCWWCIEIKISRPQKNWLIFMKKEIWIFRKNISSTFEFRQLIFSKWSEYTFGLHLEQTSKPGSEQKWRVRIKRVHLQF